MTAPSCKQNWANLKFIFLLFKRFLWKKCQPNLIICYGLKLNERQKWSSHLTGQFKAIDTIDSKRAIQSDWRDWHLKNSGSFNAIRTHDPLRCRYYVACEQALRGTGYSISSPAPVPRRDCSPANSVGSRCKTCLFIVNTSKISGPKRSVKITDRFTCTSANVIYCITCTLCNKIYIGETGRRLGDRFREHLRDVETNDKDASKPVARHFNLPNHSKKHMAICGLSLHLQL